MSILNQPIVLAIPHLTPAIQRTTYATYLEVSLRLRRMCDNDETFENYLLARDQKPSKVKKPLSEVKKNKIWSQAKTN